MNLKTNFKNFFIENYIIIFIIIIGFILRFYSYLNNGIIFWDGAVYIAMGKYFFSNEILGLYEVFRPPVFGLILGFFWYLGLNPIISGQIFILIISVISIYLIYFLGNKIFNKNIGLLAAFFLTISAVHIYYSSKVLNDNLSLFFILVIFLLLNTEKPKYFLIGLLSGLSFLTRFQNGIILPLIWLFILGKLYLNDKKIICNFFNYLKDRIKTKKNTIIFKNNQNKLKFLILKLFKDSIQILMGFLIITLPYLYYNYIKFQNPMLFLIEGSNVIKLVGKSISENIFYYPINLFYENIFLLFSFIGIYLLFTNKLELFISENILNIKEKKIEKNKEETIKKNKIIKKNITDIKNIKNYLKLQENKLLLLIIFIFAIFSFLYLSYLSRKEMRYMIIILPFLHLFASFGIFYLLDKLKFGKISQYIIIGIIGIICILSLIGNLTIYENTFKVEISQTTFDNYYNSPYLNKEAKAVLSSPILLAYKDLNPTVIYWTHENMTEYYKKLNISNYFINTCELFCLENDESCNKGKEEFIQNLKLTYNQKFYNKEGRCEYYVFTR